MAFDQYIPLLPYWIRNDPAMLELWKEGVVEFGYADAEKFVRSTPQYLAKFPGIQRDDGSFRMEENEYLATIDSYRDSLRSVGVDPTAFEETFVLLIEGDVSGSEFWQERVLPRWERIINRGDEMIERYATDWGIQMNRSSLMASLLDPDLGAKILDRQISISELRYESDRVFGTDQTNIYQGLIDELYEERVGTDRAKALFESANQMMPVLSALAARHADPDDDFDLEEFTAATLYNDPEQARRMRRLYAQEDSSFTGGAATDFARNRSGGVSGLQET